MRFTFFLILALVAYVCPWWMLLILSILYALRYPAYELIVIGVALDMLYGVPYFDFGVPLHYTVTSIAVVVLLSLVRPLLHTYRR